MNKLKKEMNEIIDWITVEELKQNIKNTEERIMNNKINNRVDVKEIEQEVTKSRKLKVIHRTINQVINLMNERDELYDVTPVYELQTLTKKIEQMKNHLEGIYYHDTLIAEELEYHTIKELAEVITWIEEEQEKYKI